MVTRVPPSEVFEAVAWIALPFALLLVAFWAIAARITARRANQFAAEDVRLDEQQRRERLARKGSAA